MNIKKLLFKLARRKEMGVMMGIAFKFFPVFIPSKKLYKDKFVVGCYHPVPSYEFHVLIVPRFIISSILKCQCEIFASITHSAESICNMCNEPDKNFLLCVNGGTRQDVKQLHCHLISQENLKTYKDYVNLKQLYQSEKKANCSIYYGHNVYIIDLDKKEENKSHKDNICSLFAGAMSVLEKLSENRDFHESGFSLKMFKRSDNIDFEERIYIELDKNIELENI